MGVFVFISFDAPTCFKLIQVHVEYLQYQ
jgi:hypothetical protein